MKRGCVLLTAIVSFVVVTPFILVVLYRPDMMPHAGGLVDCSVCPGAPVVVSNNSTIVCPAPVVVYNNSVQQACTPIPCKCEQENVGCPACPVCPVVQSSGSKLLPLNDYVFLNNLQKIIHYAEWYSNNYVTPAWNTWKNRATKPKPLQNPRKRSKDDPVLIVFMDGEMHLTVHDFTNPKWKLDECPVPCKLSKNVADGAKGNVLFYYLDKPSLLPAAAKQPKQIVGLFTLEPEWVEKPENWLRNIFFNANYPVDFIASYPQQSDVRVAYAANYRSGQGVTDKIPPKKAISAFVSNCNSEYRKEYLELLMKHFQVDSYGNCPHHTPGLPTTGWAKYGEDQKVALQESYRFNFGFESWILPDYVTEKYFHLLSAPGIGLYAGAPNIADYYPTTSAPIIRAQDYPSPMDFIAQIKELMDDDKKYLEFQKKWRTATAKPEWEHGVMDSKLDAVGAENWLCRVCEYYNTYYDV